MEQEKTARKSKKSINPSLAHAPMKLMKKMEDSEAEIRNIKMEVTITKRGIVSNAELLNISNPKLELQLQKALMLWQFLPATKPDGKSYSTVVSLPLKLRLKEEYLTQELSDLGRKYK